MKITIDLDAETAAALRELAEMEGVSQDAIINLCIRRDLDNGDDSIIRCAFKEDEAEAKERLSRAGGDNRAGVEKIPQVEQGKARDKAVHNPRNWGAML